ncbi:MAG: RrF2 family transcriptional regulator [bacterium]
MRLPTRVRYAVRAVAEIAKQGSDLPVSISKIADSQGISANYAKQIVNRLVNGGILASRKGAAGGYNLARKAQEISLLDIYNALGIGITPVPCMRRGKQYCSRIRICGARQAWRKLAEKVTDTLGDISIGEIVEIEFSLKTRRGNR